MKQAAVLLVLLAGCAAQGEIIYLRSASGEQVQCGPYQTAAPVVRAFAPETSTPQMAEAEGRLRNCVSDYQRQGFQRTSTPGGVQEAIIPVHLYIVSGPLARSGVAEIPGVVSSTGMSGRFGFVRPDGVKCQGNWSTVTVEAVSNTSLLGQYGAAAGVSTNSTNVGRGQAFGVCDGGGSFQAEYYAGRANAGAGVARDSDGNLYRLLF